MRRGIDRKFAETRAGGLDQDQATAAYTVGLACGDKAVFRAVRLGQPEHAGAYANECTPGRRQLVDLSWGQMV